ncbi:hypothetical protein GCM10010182_24580 [Actinomadura cremea]|nr:hypothetical protein GCM10010182_24580 [Actinomadura cremea]
MSEQPGDILDEAGKVFDALLRRAARTGILGGPRRPDDRDRPGAGEPGEPGGDAWARATAERPRAEGGAQREAEEPRGEPRIATGAPECRDCPVCRAIAIRRAAGGDVARHLRDAGESLMAAALDVVAAVDRTREDHGRDDRAGAGRTRDGHGRDAGTYRKRPRQESAGRPAGTSERSGERRDRPEGDAWSAATGGSGGSGD